MRGQIQLGTAPLEDSAISHAPNGRTGGSGHACIVTLAVDTAMASFQCGDTDQVGCSDRTVDGAASLRPVPEMLSTSSAQTAQD